MNKDRKLIIEIPLSTANLACGFDTFGLALDLYNTYTFSLSQKYVLHGFKREYTNNNNLCLTSYKETLKILKSDDIPVSITLDQHIYNCGGLGSSANVIIAGVAAALYFVKGKIDKDEVLKIASRIEGHPDNVAAEVYGGLTSAVKIEDTYKIFKYDVCKDLIFNVFVPSFSLSTKAMRACLPKEVSMSDAVFNISRAANLAYALKEGSLDKIEFLMQDKLHQSYRIDKIEGAKKVFEYATINNLPHAISGSGASLLIIDKALIKEKFDGFINVGLHADNEGMKIYEEN